MSDLKYDDLGDYAGLLALAGQREEALSRADLEGVLEDNREEYLQNGFIEESRSPEKISRVDPSADKIVYITQRGRRVVEEGVELRNGNSDLSYSGVREILLNKQDEQESQFDHLEGVER